MAGNGALLQYICTALQEIVIPLPFILESQVKGITNFTNLQLLNDAPVISLQSQVT